MHITHTNILNAFALVKSGASVVNDIQRVTCRMKQVTILHTTQTVGQTICYSVGHLVRQTVFILCRGFDSSVLCLSYAHKHNMIDHNYSEHSNK